MQRAAAAVLSRQANTIIPRAACTIVARPLAATVLPAHCSRITRRALHSRSAAAMASRSTTILSDATAAAATSEALTPADPSFPQASSEADVDDESSARPYEKSIARTWHLFDARDQIVGRMAGHIAKLLQGKHRPGYTPWIDGGDCVVVLNARYLQFTGKKWQQKLYRYHTGYPGGLKEIPAERWRNTHPDRILRHAIAGMIKKNKLKVPRLNRLKIYPGLIHPHTAQFPEDIIAKVPHLKAQRDEELAAEAAAKQKERDAFTLAANAGKKPAAADKKVTPDASSAGKKKAGALLDTSDDTILPADPAIRTAILKDREARKGKPYAHNAHNSGNAEQQAISHSARSVSNEADRALASSINASLMFGEILFNGVSRIMDSAHLDAAAPGTRVLYDLGSGCGRLCVQVFLQFTNLERVVGVELTSVRSNVGFAAMQRLGQIPPKGYEGRCQLLVSKQRPPRYSFVVNTGRADAPTRVLELHQGNLFDYASAWHADILICETNIAAGMQYDFLHFLANCKTGTRLLTYNNLENMHEDVCARIDGAAAEEHKAKETPAAAAAGGHMTSARQQHVKPPFPWKRLAINGFDDKFSASWGEIRFHLYTRQPSPSGSASSGVQTRSRTESFASSTASAATTPRSGVSEHSTLSAFRDVGLSDDESVGSED